MFCCQGTGAAFRSGTHAPTARHGGPTAPQAFRSRIGLHGPWLHGNPHGFSPGAQTVVPWTPARVRLFQAAYRSVKPHSRAPCSSVHGPAHASPKVSIVSVARLPKQAEASRTLSDMTHVCQGSSSYVWSCVGTCPLGAMSCSACLTAACRADTENIGGLQQVRSSIAGQRYDHPSGSSLVCWCKGWCKAGLSRYVRISR